MSVLLFMPESGGNPLESVIITSSNNSNIKDAMGNANMSRMEWKDGKPFRKMSSDSAGSMPWSVRSADLTEGDDVSSVGGGCGRGTVSEDDGDCNHSQGSSSVVSSAGSFSRQPPARNLSATSSRSAPPFHPSIVGAKQPQLRLTPMGAILGVAGGAKVVKAVNKAQERRVQRRQKQQQEQQQQPKGEGAAVEAQVSQPGVASSGARVHSGFLV